jgi:hypothetical protein
MPKLGSERSNVVPQVGQSALTGTVLMDMEKLIEVRQA